MKRSLLISSGLHIFFILITAMSLPFLAKKPIDLPPIVSIELIQITDKTKTYLTSILFSTSSKTTIHPIKRLSKVIEFGKNLRFIFLV